MSVRSGVPRVRARGAQRVPGQGVRRPEARVRPGVTRPAVTRPETPAALTMVVAGSREFHFRCRILSKSGSPQKWAADQRCGSTARCGCS